MTFSSLASPVDRCLALARFVDDDGALAQSSAIESLDGGSRLLVVIHLNKGKAFAASRVAVHDHRRGSYLSALLEESNQILFTDLIGESPNINSHENMLLLRHR